jgi:hypothetical protein
MAVAKRGDKIIFSGAITGAYRELTDAGLAIETSFSIGLFGYS